MADSLSMRSVPVDEQSTEALERSVFCSFLAANHWLQPKMLGALRLIAPVVTERPHWTARVLRGAAWRSRLNAEFLGGLDHLMALDAVAA